jgi:hypothetical protein
METAIERFAYHFRGIKEATSFLKERGLTVEEITPYASSVLPLEIPEGYPIIPDTEAPVPIAFLYGVELNLNKCQEPGIIRLQEKLMKTLKER